MTELHTIRLDIDTIGVIRGAIFTEIEATQAFIQKCAEFGLDDGPAWGRILLLQKALHRVET